MTALSLHSSNEALRRVLASLDEAPERLRTILDGESEPLIAFTARRDILVANEAAERFFGYSRHELDGRGTDSLLPERLRQPDAPPQVATTDPASVEVPGLRKDGTEIEIVWTFGSVPGPAGPLFVLVVRHRARLVAEVESLQRSAEREQDLERWFRSVYDNALDGFLVVDDEMRIVDANPAACRLLERRRERLVGTSMAVVMRAGGQEGPSSLLRDLRATGSVRGEAEILLPDGARRRAEYSAVANISPGLHLGIFRDVEDRKRAAEAELRASEERFHRLVDAVTEYAIFLLDPEGNVATWNPGAQRIKGYSRDEIIGKHVSVFYTPEDRAAGKAEKIIETVRREGRFEDESWRVRKDGSRLWANVVVSALRDDEGEITGFAKVTRDLTERRAAEEKERQLALSERARSASEAERRRLLALLGQVPAIVNVLRGPDLVYEFAHPKAVAALGGRTLVGKPLMEAVPEYRDRPEIPARIRRVLESGEPSVSNELPVKIVNDGVETLTFWDSILLPLREPDGAVEGVMTFELDVTHRVLAQREMERVKRAKDEFLATMSHELRTPLHAIQGWATVLRRKPRDEGQLDHGLEVIERNARAQTRLIGDLLDASCIITGKLELELTRAELLPIVLAAVDVVRPAADAKGVRLVVDVNPHIGSTMADPGRIQQVVWNLLTNAVRFTPAHGRVVVTGDRTAGGIVVRVQDTGAGIDGAHLPHVFERFMQVDSSTTRAHGGLGLGLAIVRHLVEAHGGVVEAHSEGLGRGATFTVTLPIQAVTTRPAEAETEAEASPAR